MNVPKDYPMSKDVIDRRNGEKPTLSDKVRDLTIKVRTDWNDMKQAEKTRKGIPPDAEFKEIGNKKVPSFKKGGKIKVTGLAYVHKGERVIPKHKAKKVEKFLRKKG